MTRYSINCNYTTMPLNALERLWRQIPLRDAPLQLLFLVSMDACIGDDFQIGEPFASRQFRYAE
jgi:hypothetical protein